MDKKRILHEAWELLKEVGAAFALFIAIQVLLYAVLGVYPAYRVVVSGSMEPVFYRGDVVFIKHMDSSQIKEADIVVFNNPYDPTPIVHRVIAITFQEGRYYFATKGDNNFSPDSYYPPPGIPGEEVVGKVIFWVPKVGLPALWFKEVFRHSFPLYLGGA